MISLEAGYQFWHGFTQLWEVVALLGRGAYGAVYSLTLSDIFKWFHIIPMYKSFAGMKTEEIECLREPSLVTERRVINRLEYHDKMSKAQRPYFNRHIVRVLGSGSKCPLKCHKRDPFMYTLMGLHWISIKEALAHLHTFNKYSACQMVLNVSDALEKFQHAGIVHRDIKPGNLLINGINKAFSPFLDQFDVLLTDYGACRFTKDKNGEWLNEEPTGRVGTIPYRSPAMARGECAGTKDDLISLLYTYSECRIGYQPWDDVPDSMTDPREVEEWIETSKAKIPPQILFPDEDEEEIRLLYAKLMDYKWDTPVDFVEYSFAPSNISRTTVGGTNWTGSSSSRDYTQIR